MSTKIMKIQVCMWKTCRSRFGEYIVTRLQNDKQRFNLNNLEVEECLCLWQCKDGPNIVVDKDIKNHMNPAKASECALKNNKKK